MMIHGIACQMISWGRRSLNQMIQEASVAGYEGCEFTTWHLERRGFEDVRQIRRQLERAGLPVVALYHTAQLCCEDSLKDQWLASTQAVEQAHRLGARFLIIGNPPKHRIHCVSGLKVLGRTLDKLGEECLKRNLILTYQPHYGGPVQTPAEIDQLINETSPQHVSLCFDTAHIARGGGDPATLMQRWRGRVPYIQLKDLRARLPSLKERLSWLHQYLRIGNLKTYYRGLHPLQQSLRGVLSMMYCAPGSGSLDFPSFKRALQNVDYQGWLTVEVDAPSLYPGQVMAEGLKFTRLLFNSQ